MNKTAAQIADYVLYKLGVDPAVPAKPAPTAPTLKPAATPQTLKPVTAKPASPTSTAKPAVQPVKPAIKPAVTNWNAKNTMNRTDRPSQKLMDRWNSQYKAKQQRLTKGPTVETPAAPSGVRNPYATAKPTTPTVSKPTNPYAVQAPKPTNPYAVTAPKPPATPKPQAPTSNRSVPGYKPGRTDANRLLGLNPGSRAPTPGMPAQPRTTVAQGTFRRGKLDMPMDRTSPVSAYQRPGKVNANRLLDVKDPFAFTKKLDAGMYRDGQELQHRGRKVRMNSDFDELARIPNAPPKQRINNDFDELVRYSPGSVR